MKLVLAILVVVLLSSCTKNLPQHNDVFNFNSDSLLSKDSELALISDLLQAYQKIKPSSPLSKLKDPIWGKVLVLRDSLTSEYLIPFGYNKNGIETILACKKENGKFKYHLFKNPLSKGQQANFNSKEFGIFIAMNDYVLGMTEYEISPNFFNKKSRSSSVKFTGQIGYGSSKHDTGPRTSWEYVEVCITTNANCCCAPSAITCDNCDLCRVTQCWGNFVNISDEYLDPFGGGGGNGEVGSGGGGYGSDYSLVMSLLNYMTLNNEQINWLSQNPLRAIEMLNYFQYGIVNINAQDLAVLHLNKMMSDVKYLNFVLDHSNSSVVQNLWWEDDQWLADPSKFNLDVDINDDQNYDVLTAQEKILVKKYPIQAAAIYLNKSNAEDKTLELFGINGLNDRSDAFRHAYFNALNRRDCGIDNLTLENIAKLFSDAHESEVPTQLTKEKEMDLWNNNIGHQIGDVIFPILTSDSYLSDKVHESLVEGNLRFLFPTLTPQQDPNYWGVGGTRDPRTATHGITNTTLLKSTNP